MTLSNLYRTGRFRAAAEKFRITQLRDGSLYTNLRALLPAFVVAGVWLRVNFMEGAAGANGLLARSVTLRHLLLAVGIVTVWDLWVSLSVYSRHSTKKDLVDEFSRLVTASCLCGALPLLANLVRRMPDRGVYVAEMVTAGMLVVAFGNLSLFLAGAALSSRLVRPRLALIVGTGRRALTLRARLQHHYARFRIFGCIDEQYCGHDATADNYLGGLDQLADLLKEHPIEVVLIGLPLKSMYEQVQQVINVCELIGVESHYMQDIFETSRAYVEVHSQEPSRFTVLSAIPRNPYQFLKRVIDFVLAAIILCLISPIMIAAALAVRFTSPGPVFFVQQRYGRDRKRFPMFKFRSMVIDAEQKQAALEQQNEAQGPVFKLKRDPRVTPVGAFLRRTSIDELPQLFNVLRGEMSLVGPRPLPLRDVSRFEEPWLLRRFSVRPGLTCLWQVNGRSNTSFDFWISQDLEYIDKWSLLLDFQILMKTVPAVLKGSGAV